MDLFIVTQQQKTKTSIDIKNIICQSMACHLYFDNQKLLIFMKSKFIKNF